MPTLIRNPVLPGFHPDPSILRVGDDYYIATSTFEWAPGVRVHHSRDLVHWRALGGILTDRRLLDLTGVPDSGGVWAPDLTYAHGLFHVVYWYYLVVAEGGTGYEHGVTVARSRDLLGPYEPDPNGPMMTSRHDPTLALQKAGHGCLVRTQDGSWYLAHLAARPYTQRGRCVLGRETAIQRVEWVDGWPRVAGGVPAVDVPAPDLPPHPWPESASSGVEWSTLRRPASPDWVHDLAGEGAVAEFDSVAYRAG